MVLFVLAGVTIQTLYSLVDIYWVSRLGEQAVAAVALSTNLMFVSLALTQTLSVGCVALVSQAAGRQDHESVQRLFNQAQSLSVCSGVVFLAAGLAGTRIYAERLSGDAATAQLACEFLAYFIPSLALQFAMVGLASALRGVGNMKPGLIAQTLSVVLNMVLAPFLIFGWFGGRPLGVAGAALSTLIGTLAALLGLMAYLARGSTYLRVRFADWRPELASWKKMLAIGLPSGLEFLLISVNMGVIYSVIRPFGSQGQAGFGIASRVMQAGFMPAVAISFAVAAVVGQNFGAKAFERVRETVRESSKLTIGFMLVITLLCQLVPDAMMRAFTSDPYAIGVGAEYLRITSYSFIGSGLVFVAAGIFQGVGNTWPSLLASAVRSACLVLPTLWCAQQSGFEIRSIWWIAVVAVALQLLLCMALLRREIGVRAPVTASTASP
jgi:putative MATE family efflux protein